MMKRSLLLAAVAAAPLCFASSAFAQYAKAPFFDNPVELSQAHGLETIGLRLTLAETFSAPYHEELVESIEEMVDDEVFSRFEGTLEAKDLELTRALRNALKAVIAAVEEDRDPKADIEAARPLLERAYATVIADDLRNDPAFKGGVFMNLLLGEKGVAEGLEEAIEDDEPWEYPNGWVSLERVKVLWDELKAGATEQRVADGQEMIDALGVLYPHPEPLESFLGMNPEEAEGSAQRLGGILEEVVNADLYPGRDAAKLAGFLEELTTKACAVYPEDDEVAVESIYAAYDLFDGHIIRVSRMFAPEAVEVAEEAFDALLEDDDKDAKASAEETCNTLAGAFKDIKAGFGG